MREVPAVQYRVYRHSQRITAANLAQAERIATVEPLAAYDENMIRISFQSEYIDQFEVPDSAIPTFRYEDGKVVQAGTVAADRWGLVTLAGLRVGKGKNRIVILKQP